MIDSDDMRKLAELLREENTRRQEAKRTKCAQTVIAAKGLELLLRKLGSRND